jgi:metal-responsive CopG/Arc/MetJ family transcriptional regulator
MRNINSKRTLINFELKPVLLERFDKILIKKGLGKSEVLRAMVNEYIEKNEK